MVPMTYYDSRDHLGSKNVHRASEYLFQANMGMTMPKYAPWKGDIDMQTLVLHSMGFDLFFSYKYLPLSARQVKQTEESKVEPLKLRHYYMMMVFYCSAITVAFLAYLFEHVNGNMKLK